MRGLIIAGCGSVGSAQFLKLAHGGFNSGLLAQSEERYRERVLRQLSQRAQKLGMQLVAAEQEQPRYSIICLCCLSTRASSRSISRVPPL